MITVLIRIAIYVIYLTLFLGVCVMKKVVLSVLRTLFAATAFAATLSPAFAADEVNLYTTRRTTADSTIVGVVSDLGDLLSRAVYHDLLETTDTVHHVLYYEA